ncbi:MAG: FtsX-like permease family protein [Actinomycetota bacterium]
MVKLMWRGMLTRKLRSALTAIAILLGVAMISGTFVLTDQITRTFDEIFATSYKGIDVVVSPKQAFEAEFSEIDPLDESLVDTIRNVPGVAVASGQIEGTGSLVVDGEFVEPAGGAPPLVFSALPDPLSPGEYVEGHAPARSGEVGVDSNTADKADVTVGQRVGLATRTGVQPVTVSGVFKFGEASSLAGATIVVPTFADAQRWFDREGRTSSILVAAQDGVSAAELTRRVAAVLPANAEARTGQQSAEEDAEEITDQINSFLRPALLAFAGVALLVGAFIIFNTFSITVAQRLRELGMLRTLGATRRQVMWSVVGEALLVGAVASAIGTASGLLFAKLLLVAFDAAGFPIPGSGVTLEARTVVIALAVGIVVSVLSALLPAVRATRVPPIAAIREGAVLPRPRFARFTPAVAALFAAGGLALVVQGLVGEGDATQRLLGMALGAVLVFVAVGMVARFVVRPLARLIGWPMERLSAGAGRLARENASRNPARTAVTASALMIGVGLVVFVAVFADGLKASITGAIDESFRGDIVVTGKNFLPFPAGAQDTLRSVPGVEVASGVRFDQARIDGTGKKNVYGVDPATLPRVFGIEWKGDGTDALYGRLAPDAAFVEDKAASSRGLDVGDAFTATSPSGTSARFRIIGRYEDPTFATDGFIVSYAGFARVFRGTDLGFLAAKIADGGDAAAVEERAKDAVSKAYPSTDVRTNREYKEEIESRIDGLLFVLYALLAMSVIISIFGIVNTLVLSITERTREIGMLRAIGVTRRQLRRMVRFESVITSVIGGVLGLAVGVLFAYVMTKGLEDEGITFSVPEVQLGVFLVLAVVVGVLAAVLPARRAARLRVLDAIHYE